MSRSKESITSAELKTQIARAVIIAPDINPKTGQEYTQEVVFTIRPGWSNINKYVAALPGGKIEIDNGDFTGVIDEGSQQDPHLILTLEQMIFAGLRAAEREVLEELGVTLAAGMLQFVDFSTNRAGWTTYSYACILPEKPTLLVKPNSSGTKWINTQRLLEGKPKLLQGHLKISRTAIKKLQ